MIETPYPAACNAVASDQTRLSKGTGRFSTMIRTRGLDLGLPMDAIVTDPVTQSRCACEVEKNLVVTQSRGPRNIIICRSGQDDQLGIRDGRSGGNDQQALEIRYGVR